MKHEPGAAIKPEQAERTQALLAAIVASSQPGVGTRVTLELPNRPLDAAPGAAKHRPGAGWPPSSRATG